MQVLKDLLNQGVYVRYTTGNGYKEIVGILKRYEPPFLSISSRGREITINQSDIREVRKALGEVEP